MYKYLLIKDISFTVLSVCLFTDDKLHVYQMLEGASPPPNKCTPLSPAHSRGADTGKQLCSCVCMRVRVPVRIQLSSSPGADLELSKLKGGALRISHTLNHTHLRCSFLEKGEFYRPIEEPSLDPPPQSQTIIF